MLKLNRFDRQVCVRQTDIQNCRDMCGAFAQKSAAKTDEHDFSEHEALHELLLIILVVGHDQ